MAQNAKIAGLTDELICSILQFDPATNRQAYKRAKDLAARGLRGHQYARTNQFDVQNSFVGLDEKCRVKNRDDLADALQLRLQRLESVTNKFKPEFLSLLLQLSDRPLENTRVEALDLLSPPSPPPQLTWNEILEEDPYSDEDIWKDIDYAVESSGDEHIPQKRKKQQATPATSVDEDDTYNPESCLDPTHNVLLLDVEAAQFWSSFPAEEGAKTEITELQAIRETLFMLGGLQTSLYTMDKGRSSVRVNARFKLSHAVVATVDHLLSQLASIGKDLLRLRQWSRRSSTLPLLQTFEAVTRERLSEFDFRISQLHRCYLTPESPVAVSLLTLYSNVRTEAEQILHLSQLVSDVEPRLLINPFSHLEELFSQTSLAQMTLQKANFDYFSGMLFDCLQTYLKPIRRWMEDGELGANDETFFVFETDSGSDAASMWHDRFVLRRDAQDQLRSPSFLQPAAMKIFNTGKSVVFLKELGYSHNLVRKPEREPRLDHLTVCGSSGDVPLSPFQELFQIGFEKWIRSKYSLASTSLRTHIFESQGLMRILNTFQMLYLGSNGAIFENLANAIFERIDSGHRGWSDRYMLTELARGIYGAVLQPQDAERIVVRSTKPKDQTRSVKGLAVVSVDYSLHWSILNIIQRSSMPIYQQFHTLLIQTYRAKYVLQQSRPTRSHKFKQAAQLIYKLRHRLTWFVDILRSYYTETVVAFTGQDMEAAMNNAADIDEMAQCHVKYVARLQERALLSEDLKPIHNAVLGMLDLGILFAKAVTDADSSESGRMRRSALRRKSTALQLVTAETSDSENDENAEEDVGRSKASKRAIGQSTQKTLDVIDQEFERLLPFITAGLRSVGRVGAEPMWEQLAERLEWEGVKNR
ncbi:microtubule cytoskeleton organization [Ascochyta rabiei]|uniref:Spindle pole body component n=1 Tax=Didymella rabiei TaxID=5454 RepID=A0A162WQS1_DIDRA|nr:microtubule cytoskeleton organization [Ascochyta rabiei]